MDILEQTNKLIDIRKNLPSYTKMQLHPGISGYDSPNIYGIYKTTGGKPLGVLGKDFHPIELRHLFDSIYQNVGDSNLDINTIEFKEYKNGKKVSFNIDSEDFEVVGSPKLNDVFKVKIRFQTGFDGRTKLSLNFSTLRLTCTNGAKSWRDDISISFKNTMKNHAKMITFTSELNQVRMNALNYKKEMESLVNVNIDDNQLNDFYKQLLGYSFNEWKSLHKKSQERIDLINKCVLEEASVLGLTEYAVLNGITRYVTHHTGKDKEENYLFGSGQQLITQAHQIFLN